LGKTFKGMTDEMLAWQTNRFQELETGRDAFTVYVRPELVVEVAFDGVQRSTRYPGGLALRFAGGEGLPAGQVPRRGRHDRHGPSHPRRNAASTGRKPVSSGVDQGYGRGSYRDRRRKSDRHSARRSVMGWFTAVATRPQVVFGSHATPSWRRVVSRS
jgi:hypothetical protein